jgi:hypothetical protein
MRIHLQNYEEYFIRYVDGELSPDEVAEVHDFLQTHPELNRELETFRQMTLPVTDDVSFPGKELLKKGITAANCDEYFVRKIEGELSPSEEKELNDFLGFHPEFRKTLGYFEATRLTADTSVVFPNKRSLKKSAGRTIPIGYRYLMTTAVAAALVAVMLIRGVDWNQGNSSGPVARQHQQPETSDSIQKKYESPDILTEENQRLAQSTGTASADEKETGTRLTPTGQPAPQFLAEASTAEAIPAPAGDEQSISVTELTPLESRKQPIYYQARQKKALYKDIPAPATASASKEPASPIGNFAYSLGTELLKLSGRGDYLPAEIASADRNKGPLALNLEGEKFGFNTTLFKKRGEKNSSTD